MEVEISENVYMTLMVISHFTSLNPQVNIIHIVIFRSLSK